jgi:N6-L-threonylcarbamoyladenine synthase
VPDDAFPAVILIVSGGHTELILMQDHGQYRLLGSTLDDAAGEAYDKVARLLDLGFPGGPAIQRVAQQGNAERFALPRPLLHHDEHRFNFSFSGLKTAVLNLVRQLQTDGVDVTDATLVADIAASFQRAVSEVLVHKTLAAARQHRARQVCICGGVSANAHLRALAEVECRRAGVAFYIPPLFLCTDNAAMIGAAAYYRWQNRPLSGNLALDVFANLPLSEAAM